MNIQDGFLTSHLERTFFKHEAELIREFLGAPDDIIDCPTEAQRALFGPKRRRVPQMIDLTNPVLLGPVQNQEHYMNGVVARRNNFNEPILRIPRGGLRGVRRADRPPLRPDHASTRPTTPTPCSSRSAPPRRTSRPRSTTCARRADAKVGSIHVNVIRPFPEAAVVKALARQEERHHPRAHRRAAGRRQPAGRATSAPRSPRRWPRAPAATGMPALAPSRCRASSAASTASARATSGPSTSSARTSSRPASARARTARRAADGATLLRARRRSSLRGEVRRHAVAAARGRDRRPLPLHRRLGHDHDRQEPRRDHRRLRRPRVRARQRGGRARAARRRSSTSARTRSTARRRRARRPSTSSSSRRSGSG